MTEITSLDANQAVLFKRQLEEIKSKSYDALKRDLMFRDIVNIDRTGGLATKFITYYSYDQTGSAKLICCGSDDLPGVDLEADEKSNKIHMVGNHFSYCFTDIATAQATGVPLNQKKADAAVRAINELLNRLFWEGAPEADIFGLLNHPEIAHNVVAGGRWITPAKAPVEILKDVNDLFVNKSNETCGVERPDTLLISLAEYNYIASTPVDAANASNVTILQYLLQTSPWLSGPDSIKPICDLDGKGAGDTGMMIAYTNDADKMEFNIAHDIDFRPEQWRNLRAYIPAFARTGGLQLYYPNSVSITDGI